MHFVNQSNRLQRQVPGTHSKRLVINKREARVVRRPVIEEFMAAQATLLDTNDLTAKKRAVQAFVDRIVVKEDTTEVRFTVGGVDILLVAPTGVEPVPPP